MISLFLRTLFKRKPKAKKAEVKTTSTRSWPVFEPRFSEEETIGDNTYRHAYPEYKKVREVLTSEPYNYTYGGTGDNAEECFYKKTYKLPETIYIHTMFCSYHMDSSNSYLDPNPGYMNRPHDVSFRSDYRNNRPYEEQRRIAFQQLLNYSDKVELEKETMKNIAHFAVGACIIVLAIWLWIGYDLLVHVPNIQTWRKAAAWLVVFIPIGLLILFTRRIILDARNK